MAEDCREARAALEPLVAAGLVKMVMVDGVESYQITDTGSAVAQKMMGCEPGELRVGIKRSKPYMDDTPEPEGAP
jgi:hypothetical protein|tara:strand:- start:22 stop:246 length:225 start_codon:yes stop_codon:yes gene_type:complete